MTSFLGVLVSAALGAFGAQFVGEWVRALVRKHQRVELHRDEDLETLLGIVLTNEQLAEKYWLTSADSLNDNVSIEAKITANQHHIIETLSDLYTGTVKWDCDVAYGELHREITGGNFGDPEREPDPQRYRAVLIKSAAFKRVLQTSRRKLPTTWLA